MPEIFKKIQEASGADDREMYQVFNMGCRMEIYTDEDFASSIIDTAATFNIDAQVIGRVEESDKKELVIKTKNEELIFRVHQVNQEGFFEDSITLDFSKKPSWFFYERTFGKF